MRDARHRRAGHQGLRRHPTPGRSWRRLPRSASPVVVVRRPRRPRRSRTVHDVAEAVAWVKELRDEDPRHRRRALGQVPARGVAARRRPRPSRTSPPAPPPPRTPTPTGRPGSPLTRRADPPAWTTLETRDLAAALAPRLARSSSTASAPGSTAVLDAASAVGPALDRSCTAIVDAPARRRRRRPRRAPRPVVLVTNEVGLGVVPAHRSGRLFRDLLGTGQPVARRACDEVHLVVAGRVIRL